MVQQFTELSTDRQPAGESQTGSQAGECQKVSQGKEQSGKTKWAWNWYGIYIIYWNIGWTDCMWWEEAVCTGELSRWSGRGWQADCAEAGSMEYDWAGWLNCDRDCLLQQHKPRQQWVFHISNTLLHPFFTSLFYSNTFSHLCSFTRKDSAFPCCYYYLVVV